MQEMTFNADELRDVYATLTTALGLPGVVQAIGVRRTMSLRELHERFRMAYSAELNAPRSEEEVSRAAHSEAEGVD